MVKQLYYQNVQRVVLKNQHLLKIKKEKDLMKNDNIIFMNNDYV